MDLIFALMLAVGTFGVGAGTVMLIVDLDEVNSGVRQTVTHEAVFAFAFGVSAVTCAILGAVL